MRALLNLLASLTLASCAPGSSEVYAPILPSAHDKRPAIIFVHGYYGTALTDPLTGKREFANPLKGIYGHLSIARHSEELGTRPSPKLKVEGMWSTVVVVPFLYETPVYRPVIDILSAMGDFQIVPYSYDWRQDVVQSAQGLGALVKLLKDSGVPSVSIAAHSMGGLVASYYLGYGSQPLESAKLNWEGAAQVKRVVYFGTPFRGAMSIVRNMQHGTGYPWNPAFIEAATAASFEASYYACPMLEPSFVGEEGAYIPLDLTQEATWKEWHLGYYHQKAATAAIEKARADYTAKMVEAASTFFRLLKFSGKAPPADLKILNVIGSGTRTIAKGYANFATHELYFRKAELKPLGKEISLLEEDGDGTVPALSAELPEPLNLRARELHTTRTHGELFLDPKIEKEYVQFLSDPTGL